MIKIPSSILHDYSDVITPQVIEVLQSMVSYQDLIKETMHRRMLLRTHRQTQHQFIDFLAPETIIPRTTLSVHDARKGKFEGADIPPDLRRQWIQGTGPAAKPNTTLEKSIRNIAYALLSGADGWMFDGEDALGQTQTMSLDNQRNLKLAIHKDPVFLHAAKQVAVEMNSWSQGFLGKNIIEDWKKQLDFTTKIFRARGLHLDDRHLRNEAGHNIAASIVDLTIYVVNNYQALHQEGSSIVLYLPKIQTAAEAAVWNDLLTHLETLLSLPIGSIKTYVLVEQLEATYQLMEIRAVLGKHFVGFNTGRWDYINSVADALSWDTNFINPNIESITMTYGYMRVYEDRVRRAVNTPDLHGRYALWQGGMEPNIPVGSVSGVQAAMSRALAGAEREQKEGASGKWVAHWKMVHIVRPVWEKYKEDNQLGRQFKELSYTAEDAQALRLLEPAPRTIRGARNLISVALQYGNAFLQGMQAAALKPADFFGNDDILYLMEDMATGEIRLSILWEWVHKKAEINEDDPDTGIVSGTIFDKNLFIDLFNQEYDKLINAADRDVHDDSKMSTLPIARNICKEYVLNTSKVPWFVDVLNINLNNNQLEEANRRIQLYIDTLKNNGIRLTENLDY